MSASVQSWTDRLDGKHAADVSALLDRATAADGATPVSEQGVHAVSGVGGDGVRHLVETDADRIVGYAQLQPGHGEHPAMAELAVDPEARGRGSVAGWSPRSCPRVVRIPGCGRTATCLPRRRWRTASG